MGIEINCYNTIIYRITSFSADSIGSIAIKPITKRIKITDKDDISVWKVLIGIAGNCAILFSYFASYIFVDCSL